MREHGVAWVTAAPEPVTAVRSAKQYLTYVASGPFQYAVAEALALPDTYFEAFRADMRAKRDVLAAGLADAGSGVFRTAGTYFITTDIRPLGEKDGFAFCRALPERAGWWPLPTRCSTTTARRGRRSCGSPSASARRCCGRRRSGCGACEGGVRGPGPRTGRGGVTPRLPRASPLRSLPLPGPAAPPATCRTRSRPAPS
ncbi:aminotransferase class I/II-fold pyridoxal phosphate-dependent enzyme [Streptomyces sp. DHE7-1]|nr:aminotransferase class I/II-fold pyridoxal phosphate-dependent enzyme [Streptomyces sp. DHE7-1]